MSQQAMAGQQRARREELIERFESAWGRDEPPNIDAYLNVDTGDRFGLLVELVFADLECRLKRNEAASVEGYLQRYPELAGQIKVVLDLIAAEFGQRVRREPTLGLEEFVRRFPEHADALRERIQPPRLQHAEPSTGVLQESQIKDPGGVLTTRPFSRPAADWPPQIGAYRIEGEIGRGGMGVVLRAHDPDFGRTLAIKVLLSPADPILTQRFLDESEITARLQHPGIAPVHDRGTLDDGRPYFTMKLIDGRTLHDLLKERKRPDDDLHRFSNIFAHVCQTLAYAHSRGVIHRDLKPANIMVGAFGEIQVMDWGLAKEVRQGDTATTPALTPATSAIRSPPHAPGKMSTQAGTILGTPAFMPPEQAHGLVDELDQRSDVFGLGAILCFILTGKPPYVGPSSEDAYFQARKGDLADAHRRLDQSGADSELVSLAKQCLNPRRQERPHDAGVLAEAMAAYQAGVQERLRAAELERAAAQVKACEDRKRRKLRVALTAALAGLVLMGGGSAWWLDHKAGQRGAEIARQEGDLRTGITSALELAAVREQELRWGEARAILDQARDRLGTAELADLGPRLNQAIRHIELVIDLDGIRLKKSSLVEGKYDWTFAEPGYEATFKSAGLGRVDEPPGVVAERIGALPAPIRAQVVAALDDWAGIARGPRVGWLLEVARRADPDPDWGDPLRDPGVWNDRVALANLASRAPIGKTSPALLSTLAIRLGTLKGDPTPLLLAAQAQHPADFWLNFQAANQLSKTLPEESMAFYRAALATRPKASIVYNNIGNHLWTKGRLDDALAAFDKAIALDPQYPMAHNNRGLALRDKGRLDDALAAYDRSIALDPKYAYPHLGRGLALQAKGLADKAIAAFEKAIDLDPKDPKIRYNLGNAVWAKGRADEAMAAFEKAIALDPNYSHAHLGLGSVLQDQGLLDDALREFEKALALNPHFVSAHINRGNALAAMDLTDDAIAAFEKAIALNPKSAMAHHNLGNALRERGRLHDAQAQHEKALELFSATDPGRPIATQRLQLCRRMNDLDQKLPAILQGENPPSNAAELVELAELCRWKQLYSSSVRFYRDAFVAQPSVVANLGMEHRFHAACAAVLAGANQGVDAAANDLKRGFFRRQGLAWLQADLDGWTSIVDRGTPGDRQIALKILRRWQTRASLASVRGDGVAMLPDAEQGAWRQLWNDVAELVRSATAAKNRL